jgi:phage tail protein X
VAAGLTAVAHAGEPLDALIWRTLGTAAVEAVLAANRGLAQLGAFLPEGTIVALPELAAVPAAEQPLIQFWD